MADVSKTGTPSLSTPAPRPPETITGLLAGEAIAAGDAVYLKTSDGLVYLADGSAADELAEAIGLACTAVSSGEPITIARFGSGLMFAYGPNVSGTATPAGNLLYIGAAAGSLANAATTGGDIAVAWSVGDGRICLDTPPFANAPAAAT